MLRKDAGVLMDQGEHRPSRDSEGQQWRQQNVGEGRKRLECRPRRYSDEGRPQEALRHVSGLWSEFHVHLHPSTAYKMFGP